MTTFLLIMLVYVLIVFTVGAVGAILRFRYLKHQQHRHSDFCSMVNDSVDEGMDNLSIEAPGSMVSIHTLASRGSWRIALDQVISSQTFEEMKAEEYSKKL